MTFHPTPLRSKELNELKQKFADHFSQTHQKPSDGTVVEELFAQCLGYTPGENTAWAKAQKKALELEAPHPLADRKKRHLLWRLLSVEMAAGMAVYSGLCEIIDHGLEMGFSQEFVDVLLEWKRDMEQGKDLRLFFLEQVLPVDSEEGIDLYSYSMFGSFQDSLERIQQTA